MTGEEMAALLADVTIAVDVSLFGAEEEPITAVFSYAKDDPHAVSAVFETREGSTSWVFGRELLREGLEQASGEGSVTVGPGAPDTVHIDLHSYDGAARLICDANQLRWFVDQVFAAVPDGMEETAASLESWLTRLSL